MSDSVKSSDNSAVWLNKHWYFDARHNILRKKDGAAQDMEHQLFVLLDYFIRREQQVLSKDLLLQDNWPGRVVNEDSLTVAISKLRKVFGEKARQPSLIKTIPGVGYQFIGQVQPAEYATEFSTTQSDRASLLRAWPLFAAVLLMSWLAVPLLLHEPAPSQTMHPDAGAKKDLVMLQELTQQSEQAALSQIPELLAQWRTFLIAEPEQVQGYWYLAWLKIRLLGQQLPEQPQHFGELNALLQKVVTLEPTHAEAWSWLARLHFWHQADYAQAASYYQQALQLKKDAGFYYGYAEMQLARGKFDETVALVDKARQLRPHDFAFPGLAWAYQLSGRSEEAWQELLRITQTERASGLWHRSALRITHELGLDQQSFASMRWLLQQTDEGQEQLAAVEHHFHQGGLTAVYRYLLGVQFSGDIGHYRPPLSWARYAILADEHETALQYFEQTVAIRQAPLLWAAVDPFYQPLHCSPPFQRWLETLQLGELLQRAACLPKPFPAK
ncbi:winged helix-turn-helix domain-containing protein [Alkalimonas amylolytica]|uniref:Transcriptional regulatory protein, C terminal n=1 Tax=Alkalimonas amylolytica TaxID=152573 RepID=A0A1H4EIY8_ALKAM|nr:winged helix-turn-helix domain-containing protein [Alkalimonas amylolytica]SEA85034.1 Transcriptional regulatory protein, C terminal [Alkalimonas amylolytica]